MMRQVPAGVDSCLDRLAPHLRLDDVAITGGIAIDIGMAARFGHRTRDRIDDIDLVARSIDVVEPAVTRDFLVSHYHVAGPGVPKFLVQLVDPVTRIRVDVFPDLAGSIGRARLAPVGAHALHIVSLEDILDHKLQTLSNATPGRPVDPKHERDARTIALLLGRAIPSVSARCLADDVYRQEDEGCERCELSRSTGFPLAPARAIAGLLGWSRATLR